MRDFWAEIGVLAGFVSGRKLGRNKFFEYCVKKV